MKKAFRIIPIIFITLFSIQVYGQIPTITSFTPTSGPIGTTVTITGLNFNTTAANNIVWFGAVKATVTAATATSLTVTVPTGATYQPITVTTGGYTAYSGKPFSVTFESTQVIDANTFAAKVDFVTPNYPFNVAIGDIDGDGKPDLVVSNFTSGNVVSVYRNTSTSGSITTGSFAAKIDFSTGNYPYCVALGDIDGDGKLDMAVTNSGSSTVSVFRNTSTSGTIGAGSFSAKVDFTTGTSPQGIAISDIDGDGKSEMIVANPSSNTVSVFRNTSTSGTITTGSFAAKVDFATTGSTPSYLAIGDIDGDGKPDISVTNSSSNTMAVFRNTSTSGSITTGSFATNVFFTTGANPQGIALGDFDGDGKADLAVANSNSNSVSVYRNISSPGTITTSSFASKVDFTAGSGPYGIAVSDIDSDGKLDLAVTNNSPGSVSIFKNTSTSGTIVSGSFAANVDFTAGTGQNSIAIGDLDGDGKPDLAVGNMGSNTVSVLRNTITGSSLAAHYQFSNNTNDATAYARNGTGTGITFTTDALDATASACYFNNTASISVGDYFESISQISFSCWVNPQTTAGTYTVLSKYNSQTQLGGYSFNIDNGKLNMSIHDLTDNRITCTTNNPVVIAQNWQHIAVVIDLTQATITDRVKIYYNGVLQPLSYSFSYNVSLIPNTTVPFRIGVATGTTGVSQYFYGKMDALRVYTAALTQTDINSLELEFPNSVTDPDGNTYQPVTIGTQTWTQENLKTTIYNDGTAIPNITVNATWAATTTPAYCFYNNDAATYKTPYGALYNWYVVDATSNGGKNVCPTGWHVPADEEWTILETYLGGITVAGGKLKELGTTHWTSPNSGADNSSGFTALPGGYRDLTSGSFYYPNQTGYWWSSTPNGSGSYWGRGLSYNNATSLRAVYTPQMGFSIRCIQGSSATLTTPTIASFMPTSGSFGTAVTITGTNFSTTPANNIVYFGGVKATVTAATSTTLSVTVPAGATYQPISITVGGLTAYTSKPFTVTFAGTGVIDVSSFGTKVDFAAGTGAYSSALGDLDGDGKLDMVVSNNTANTISLFRNTSTSGSITTGSFAPKVDLTTATWPEGVAIGDIDGDGKLDIVVTNYNSASVSIFRNIHTSGAFTPSSFAAKVDLTTGTAPEGVAIGDVDGDGKPDLAVTNFTSNTVSVFRNISATGTITFSAKVDFSAGTGPVGVAFSDLDGDGKTDLAITNSTAGSVSVYRNLGVSGAITTSSFAAKVDFTAGTNPWDIAIGDIDGDGLQDIAVSNMGSSNVSVFRNTSTAGTFTTGSLATKVDFPSGTGAYHIAMGDLDGNGKPDLAVSNNNSTTVGVFKNTSTSGSITAGSFATKVDFAVGTQPAGVSIGDMDGDGKLDLTVVNYTNANISVLRNTIVSSTVPTITSFAPTSGPIGTTVTITGTNFSTTPANNIVWFGAVKASVTAATATSLTVNVPTGATYQPISITVGGLTAYSSKPFNVTFPSTQVIDATSFTTKVDFTSGTNPIFPTVFDIDGDGKIDIVLVNNGTTSISAFRNISTSGAISTGSLAGKIDFTTLLNPWGQAVGDIDGDGKLDVVLVDNGSGSISIYRNTSTSGTISTGSFATKVDFTTGTGSDGPQHVAIGDIDMDGKPDLVVSNGTSNTISVFRNISTPGSITTASLAPKVEFSTGTNPGFISLSDIDGDGKLDIVVLNNIGNSFSILRNISTSGSISTSSFSAKVDFTADAPWGLAIGDIDGDGKPDIVTSSTSNATFSVFRNTSTSGSISASSLATKVDFAVGNNPLSIAIGDLDGDSKPDVALSNKGSNTISVLRNTSTSGSITTSSFATKVDFTTGANPWGVAIGDIDGDGKPDLIVANNTATSVSVLRNTISGSSLVVYYPFNGNANDASGYGHNGINNGAILTTDRFGNANSAYYFDGSTSYITVGSNLNLINGAPHFTIGAWVNMPEYINGRQYTILGERESGQNYQYAIMNQGPFSTYWSSTAQYSNSFSTGAPLSLNNWHFVTITYDGVNLKHYINGNEVQNNATTGNIDNLASTLYIGAYAASWGTTDRFKGSLDDIRIYNKVLSPSEIYTLYHEGGWATPPVITSFTPTSGAIGSTVTITGTGFSATAANNTVYFGAVKATVTAATATSLTVTVPTGATYQPITVTVGGLTASSSKPFNVTFSSSGVIDATSFATKVDFSTGASTNPQRVAFGDVDGDGKSDLVVANRTVNTISVYRNISTSGSISAGSFSTKVDFTAGVAPETVIIKDIDGDGKLDIIVPNSNSNSISVFRNTSTSGSITTGSFAAKVDFTTGLAPTDIAIGDIDSDGKPDIAVSNWSGNSVSVFQNMSTPGTVIFSTKVDFSTGANPNSISIGDFDGDGKSDLAVTNINSSSVSIFKNTSTVGAITSSSFAAKVDFTTLSYPFSIVIGDVDGDDKQDFIVTYNNSNVISAFRNISVTGSITTSSFASNVNFSIGSDSRGISFGDIDGDGKIDIAVTNKTSNTVSILKNTSSSGSFTVGSFGTKVDFSVGSNPVGVSIGDIDGDNKPDLIIANFIGDSFSVLRNTIPTVNNSITFQAKMNVAIKKGRFIPATDSVIVRGYFNGWISNAYRLLDPNADSTYTGTFNVGTATPSEYKFVIRRGGVDDWEWHIANRAITLTGSPQTLAAVYFDDDSNAPAPTITSFTPASGAVGTNVTITGTNFSTTTYNNYVWFGTVRATVTAATTTQLTVTVPLGATYQPIAVTVNGLTGYSSKPFNVTFSSAQVIDATTFASKVDLTAGLNPWGVAIADIDGDGKLDIACLNKGSNSISLYRNISATGSITTSSFSAKVDIITGSNPEGMCFGDLDGDGKLDLVVSNGMDGTVSVFRNISTSGSLSIGSFSAKVDFTAGAGPNGVAVGDLDGDGRPDLVVSNWGGNISVLRNLSSTYSISTGSFATKVDFATGTNPRGIALGDIDGDGKLDIVGSNEGSPSVSILRNASTTGSITISSFASKVDFTTTVNPWNIALSDIDGDGKLDMAVSNGSNVSVFRNISTSGSITSGSFGTRVDFPTGSSTMGLSVGDIDGDGKPDILSSNLQNSLSVLRNISTSGSITSASLTGKVDFTLGASPVTIAIGDLDGDGKPDIVAANNGGSNISVLRNQVAASATAPTITSFTPSSGLVGSSVTINGTNFGATQGTSTVKFGTTTATPTSWSATQIIVTVPTLADGQYTISVTTSVGLANSSTQFTVTSAATPTISSFTPASGIVGSQVTINGTNFGTTQGSSTVKFGTTVATATWSATQIIATVPVLANGLYTISVTTTAGTASSSTQFNVTSVATPTITSFTPASGIVGSQVTINGTNFGTTQGSSTVKFGTTLATATWSATQIIATVPALANGLYTISVTTTAGTANSSTQFTVLSSTSPTISSFSPASGMVGSYVTVNGTNFGATQGTSTIKFGTTAAVTSNWSATQIVATVPALTAGSYTISVTTANGTVNSSTQFKVTTQQCTIPLIPKKKGSLNILICQTPTASYQWYKDDVAITGATKQFYIARKTYGSYSVQVSLTNGCSDRSPAILVQTGGSISVYPNPGDKVFNVELNFEDMGFTTIKLVNAFGTVKRVITVNKDTDIQTIPMSIEDLEKGIYVIDVEVNGEKIETQKVVII